MLTKWLYDKTINNSNPVVGGAIGAILLNAWPVIPAAAAVDLTLLSAKGIGKVLGATGRGFASASKAIRDARTRAAVEHAYAKHVRDRRKHELAVLAEKRLLAAVDPLDIAVEHYVALQRRICLLPVSDDEKQALHTAAEVRLVRALQERINGLG